MIHECRAMLKNEKDSRVKLDAIETLRRIAETQAKIAPQGASREEILKGYSNADIIAEYRRRDLVVEVHMVDDREDGPAVECEQHSARGWRVT